MGVIEVEAAALAEVAGSSLIGDAPNQLQFTLQSIAEMGGGTVLMAAGAGLAVHGVYRYARAHRDNRRARSNYDKKS
jgi:hypothetical protein